MKITVVGTGYVGLSIAVLLAQHNEVVAIDLIEEKVKLINSGKSPIVDKEIDEYIKSKNLIGQTEDLLYLLMKDETVLSTYVALQIAGNESFRSKYGFERLTKD